jgi:succinoglycan biosynthesis protein ExoM
LKPVSIQAIDICVCTFRRAAVADTLASIGQLQKPAGVALRVIVADNDETPSARDLVLQVAAEQGLDLVYVHCPASNISLARNACLDHASAAWIAFLDDDEIATPGWLDALVQRASAGDVEVVLGPVRAIYPNAAPAWMPRGDFHATRPVWVEGTILTGYTCNVLFNRESTALAGQRFRLDLGRSGGEDTDFFDRVVRAGGRIAFTEAAEVTEIVTPSRASFRWLLQRRFRSGQTHGSLLLALDDTWTARCRETIVAGAKAIACFGGAVGTFLDAVARRRWLLRAALHVGVVARLIGRREIVQYGADRGKRAGVA